MWISRNWLTAALVPLAMATGVAPSAAQDPRAEESRRSRRRAGPEEFLARKDANGNGLLDPDEAGGRGRFFIQRAAEEAGLDPTKPIPLDRLRQAMRARVDRGGRPERAAPDRTGQKPDAGAAEAAAGRPKPSREPLVPGFGVKANTTKVAGFGTAASANDGDGPGTGFGSPADGAGWWGNGWSAGGPENGPGGRTSGSSGQGGGGNDGRDRIGRYAESLLRQNDRNGNGTLEREEWSRMRGDPAAADTNGDGLITKEELAERLMSYSNRNPSGGSAGGDSDSTGPGSAGNVNLSSVSKTRKSYRFLTPTQRLPKGLPDWFTRHDADADGQVLMCEFASVWSEAKAGEFGRYDLNGDGVITPPECRKAQTK